MSHYNNYTRQEAYDNARHHLGRAESATINMRNWSDWQAYQQNRQHAFRNTLESIHAVRKLWRQDKVVMGGHFATRADWMETALQDLRKIARYVSAEQNILSDRHTLLKQRKGMRDAWQRTRETMIKVSNTYALNA